MTTTSDQIIRADHVPGPPQGQWTYAHYAALPNDEKRFEIVNGVLYMSPPSPDVFHQEAASLITTYLTIYIKFKGLGRVFSAPLDVELAPDTVLQPDVCVVLNENNKKCTTSHIIGSPDLVVEIASPSTVVHDRHRKRLVYAKAGVKEYWLVDAKQKSVEVLVLEAGEFHSLGVFQGENFVRSRIVPEFPVHAMQLFD